MKKFLILVILAWQGECMVLKKNPYPGGIHPQVIPRPEGSSDIIMQGDVKDESGDAEGGYWWDHMGDPWSNNVYYPTMMNKQWGNDMHHPNMMNKHWYNDMYHPTIMNKYWGNNMYHTNMVNKPWRNNMYHPNMMNKHWYNNMYHPTMLNKPRGYNMYHTNIVNKPWRNNMYHHSYMTGGLPRGMGGIPSSWAGMRSSIGDDPSIGGSNNIMPISEDSSGGMDVIMSPEFTINVIPEFVQPGLAVEAEGGYKPSNVMDPYNTIQNSLYKVPY